jgi:hypothetical protein
MITASENDSQGGIMAYDYRVLDWDPYRVITS